MTLKAPTTLNGHRVTMSGPRVNMTNSLVVLVDRGEEASVRYVVATWAPNQGNGWWAGNYTNAMPTALKMFNERLDA
jgi:hypothetical protein